MCHIGILAQNGKRREPLRLVKYTVLYTTVDSKSTDGPATRQHGPPDTPEYVRAFVELYRDSSYGPPTLQS